MIRLILADLLGHARVWTGIFAVITAAGFVAAIATGLLETGMVHGGRVRDGLASSSSAVIMFTAVTALIVLSASANLTVALQQRTHALWQLVGIRPALVALAVIAQLGTVAVAGGTTGALIARSAFEPLFVWTFREWTDMQGISLHLSVGSIAIAVVAIAAVVLLGGLRGARRASRTPPIEALREPEPPEARLGWLRIVATCLALGGTIILIANLDGEASVSAFSGQAILLTPLIAAVLAAAGPIVFPIALRAWTSLVPARASATWFLARNSARYRLSRSTAAVAPLMVAIALAGGLYTTGATLAAAQAARTGSADGFSLAPEGVVLLLGGPLLLSGVAAAATVFMSGQAREREHALVRAAGSTQGAIVLAALWECVIYTVTAAFLGAAATVIGGIIIAHTLALPAPTVSLAALGVIASGGFVLILAANISPTAAALRHEIPRTLSVE
ncbi:ABC transporter permease family protein [Microbacterium halophytorum]|uniref:FtsX-like permease family protein n=1 Tax=Microbacterium halophytorum TaxID=2067568 RepID=UPI000CFA9906|nr:FtsX-like permease family protein [Microbacterium halophytorum]